MAVFTNYIRIAVVISVIGFVSSIAQGMVVDGQLDDWGVTPFADWTPMAGTAYILDNWGDKSGQHGASPNGAEVFDLDAGNSRYDASNLYVAIWSMMLPNVPEPSVIALLAMGVVGLPLRRRMK